MVGQTLERNCSETVSMTHSTELSQTMVAFNLADCLPMDVCGLPAELLCR